MENISIKTERDALLLIGLNIPSKNNRCGISNLLKKNIKSIELLNNFVAKIIANKYGNASNAISTPLFAPFIKDSYEFFLIPIINIIERKIGSI